MEARRVKRLSAFFYPPLAKGNPPRRHEKNQTRAGRLPTSGSGPFWISTPQRWLFTRIIFGPVILCMTAIKILLEYELLVL